MTRIPSATATIAAPGSGWPNIVKEFGAFADPIMLDEMERNHIPGAAFIVVKDGQVFHARGYGYADLERKIPWDPDRTVLRAKSISKLVTATAVMQLYERGEPIGYGVHRSVWWLSPAARRLHPGLSRFWDAVAER